jgi:GNAT superfamily N-acetyltransferase
MATDLTIHAASGDELAAAHRNVFDIWSKGLPLEDHVRSRLNSPSHSRATWFVGCLADRVVVSLGCYPLMFCLDGMLMPGIAIGSVYTLGEFRGQGFAGTLLEWVENHARSHRAALSVLYSDIEPGYYARRGYVLCPSWVGWLDPCDAEPAPTHGHRLVPVSAREHLPRLAKLYADYHGGAPLSVARDQEYWQAILKKFVDDKFYALEDGRGAWSGYVRVGSKEGTWRITDFALANQSVELAEQFYAALLSLAAAGGAERVGGWLPDSQAARKFFELEPRGVEITMIKPLGRDISLSDEAIASTSRFCEIDHV